jgi:hypothetical protein
MMQYLKIKNWSTFQQYKDRDPKWIKVYRDLLDDYGFSNLSETQQIHLIKIWLLAAKLGNKIPNDPKWVALRIGAQSKVELNQMVTAGFLCPYNSVQNCTDLYLETETETDKEKDKEAQPAPQKTVSKPEDIDQQIWQDFLDLRRQKKAKLTLTAWERIRKELDRGKEQGYTPNDMMAEAVASGWQAFKLDWYLNRVQKSQPEIKRARTELR